jgi:Sulfotransferase family
MPLPNTIIIGAPRCGTTTVHAYLAAHPDVFMSATKEPHYWSFQRAELHLDGPGDRAALAHIVTERDDYERLFSGVDGERVIGESSTSYMYFPRTAEAIQDAIPGCKIIAMLRDPVARTHSDFLRQLRNGDEPLSFEEALVAEAERIEFGWAFRWHYRQRSFYFARLNEYFARFAPESIRVFLLEDLNDEHRFITDLCECLEIKPIYEPGLLHLNRGVVPRSRQLQQSLGHGDGGMQAVTRLLPSRVRRMAGRAVRAANTKKTLGLDADVDHELRVGFRSDIERTQELIGRDLSHWLP